jgi:hypothetical protein
MPSGSPVFIGFKLMAEEKTLLGWIKIEGSQVQTAVQEEK